MMLEYETLSLNCDGDYSLNLETNLGGFEVFGDLF